MRKKFENVALFLRLVVYRPYYQSELFKPEEFEKDRFRFCTAVSSVNRKHSMRFERSETFVSKDSSGVVWTENN